jgi:ribosomal protein S18 acetylase RimI-like enzyme
MKMDVVHEIEDVEELHAVYQTHWWFADRSLEDIRQSLKESDEVFGIRDASEERLVASCRVLTDYTFTGKILDVIVAESYRRQGVGSALIRAVTSHPQLAAVEELTLNCREGIAPFYERLGFEVHEMIQQGRARATEEDYYVMVYN